MQDRRAATNLVNADGPDPRWSPPSQPATRPPPPSSPTRLTVAPPTFWTASLAYTGQIVAVAADQQRGGRCGPSWPVTRSGHWCGVLVTVDGAYDHDGVYADVADRHPDTAAIVPPRCTAVLSGKAATAPSERDRHLRCIAETGRMSWQKASGYNTRAKIEATIARGKQVIGDGLRCWLPIDEVLLWQHFAC